MSVRIVEEKLVTPMTCSRCKYAWNYSGKNNWSSKGGGTLGCRYVHRTDPVRSQNLNFKVIHVRCINYSTDIFAFFSILNYPILASSYVYYFYFSSIEIIDIKSTPDCLAIIIIPQSTSNPNTSIRHPYFYKVYQEKQPWLIDYSSFTLPRFEMRISKSL